MKQTVKKAALTVTVNDASVVYGEEAEFSLSYSGFVNGEDESALDLDGLAFTGYTVGDSANQTYEIKIDSSGVIPMNYAYTFVSGTLTVTPRPLVLAWGNVTNRFYGDGKTVTAAVKSGLYGDDTVTLTLSGGDETAGGSHTAVAQLGEEDVNYYLTNAEQTYTIQEEGFGVEDIPVQIYTGSALKPEPVVHDGSRILTKNQDYTLSYKNNTKVGTGQIVIKGKGNYAMTLTAEFEITAQDIGATSSVTAISSDKAATAAVTDENGNLLSKWYSYPTVKYGKLTLKRGTDYTVDGFTLAQEDTTGAYTVTVSLSGKGNYTGTREVTYRIATKNISGVVIGTIAAQTYTGSALEPEVVVYASSAMKKAGTALTEDTDYTVEYANNTAVGTGKIILTGIGAYSGTKTITFKINKKSLAVPKSGDEITVQLSADGETWLSPEDYSAIYTGAAQKPQVQVVYQPSESSDDTAVTLTEGTDYKLSWKNNVNAVQSTTKSSSYPTVTITGRGSYSGSRSVSFTITPLTLTTENTQITAADVKYTSTVKKSGAKPTLTVEVKLGEENIWTTLKKGTAYTVTSYENNTSIGDAKVFIAGKGNYTTSEDLTASFRIYESAASGFYVTVTAPEGNSSMTYTGGTIEPTITVYKNKTDQKNKTNALTIGTDYRVSYTNNVNAGSNAQVLVTGLGTYGGTKVVKFTIAKQSLTTGSINLFAGEDGSCRYTGKAIKLTEEQLIVTDESGTELSVGKDYTVSYKNNTKVGSAQLTVTGKGNYKGSLKGSFAISQMELTADNTEITVADVKYTATIGRSGAKPAVTVKVTTDDGRTLTLKKNTDYTVTYSDNTAIGNAKVSIAGKGNYSTAGLEDDALSRSFRIYKTAASSLYVVVEGGPYYYSGSQIIPTVSVYTKKGGDLVNTSSYTLTYGANENVGTGKIYLTGLEDYGGTKTVSFSILSKR